MLNEHNLLGKIKRGIFFIKYSIVKIIVMKSCLVFRLKIRIRGENGCDYEETTWMIFLVMKQVCVLTMVWLCNCAHMITLRRVCDYINEDTQISACKSGEIWTNSVDCTKDNFMVMILYCFMQVVTARRTKMDRILCVLFLKPSCDPTITST